MEFNSFEKKKNQTENEKFNTPTSKEFVQGLEVRITEFNKKYMEKMGEATLKETMRQISTEYSRAEELFNKGILNFE